MDLSFPNAARSFDDAKLRIRFIGYDGVVEVKCFIPVEVVKTGRFQRAASEREYLEAFDDLRGKIQDVARRVYKSERRASVMLEQSDFR